MADQNERGKVFYVLSFAFQLGLMIAIPVVGFLLLGVFLDRKFGTLPWLLILFSIFGCVVAAFEVASYIMPIFKKPKR